MLSLAGFFGDRDGTAIANAGGSGAREASFDTVQLEAAYNLGPGVPAVGVLGYARLAVGSGFGSDIAAAYGVPTHRPPFCRPVPTGRLRSHVPGGGAAGAR